ncbi:MAG TPA: hypothetical protein VII78_09445 [Myxococcota bacterium]
MAYEIRAMSLGEIVDTSFRITRNHFVPLVGMSAVIYVPFTLVLAGWQMQLQAQAAAGAQMNVGAMLGSLVAVVLTFSLVMPIVSAAVSHAIGEAYLGREVNIAGSLREALRIVLPLVGTGILSALILIVATFLLVIPGIWFGLGIMVLYPINVMERVFGMTSIRRSLDLMKDNRGRGVLLYLLIVIISAVLGGVFGLIGVISPWVGALVQGVASAVTGAFMGAVMIVFYFDLRCRKEAFDVEHLARLVQAGAAASA